MACLVCKPKSAHSNPLARRFRAAARRRSYPILLGDGADFWHESSHSICGGWHCDEPALYGISAIRDQNLVAVDLDDLSFSVEAHEVFSCNITQCWGPLPEVQPEWGKPLLSWLRPGKHQCNRTRYAIRWAVYAGRSRALLRLCLEAGIRLGRISCGPAEC